jgi:hypothetical protein
MLSRKRVAADARVQPGTAEARAARIAAPRLLASVPGCRRCMSIAKRSPSARSSGSPASRAAAALLAASVQEVLMEVSMSSMQQRASMRDAAVVADKHPRRTSRASRKVGC